MGRLNVECFPNSPLEKPREKASRLGFDSLSDAELLALLLDTGDKKENVVELSYRYLGEKGGLKGVFFSSNDLLSFGVKEAKAFRLLAVREILKRLPFSVMDKILSDEEAFLLTHNLIPSWEKENLVVYYLGRDKTVLAKEIHTLEERNRVILPVGVIVRKAIMDNASFVLLVHNHPSGKLFPSMADLSSSQDCYASLSVAGIVLLDCLIISEKEYFSLRKNKMGPYFDTNS